MLFPAPKRCYDKSACFWLFSFFLRMGGREGEKPHKTNLRLPRQKILFKNCHNFTKCFY